MWRLSVAALMLCVLAPRGSQAAPFRNLLFTSVLDSTQRGAPDTDIIDSGTASRLKSATSFDTLSPQGTKWPKPTLTLVKSMVVPGWGQITNRKYVKAAIAIGLETWFIYGAAYEWSKMNDALVRLRTDSTDFQAFPDYNFHRGNRADYLWFLGITVFVSMFDAYVDAHLRPYDDDTIPDVEPPPGVALVLVRF
jgi:hypothetical protein